MCVGGRSSIRERSARLCACALVLSLLLLLAGVAHAAVKGRYHAHTSQGLPVSFGLSRGRLTGLAFEIKAVCPSRHVWRVDASGFPPIRISKSHFNETFGSRKPSARATVKGQVGTRKVTGSLTMKRFIAPEGHYCHGTATFTVHR
jgi:hypothetical protein